MAALAIVGLAALRSAPVRAWASSVTGEESDWEALKGVVALAGLALTGPEPDLAPEAPIRHLDVGRVGLNVFLQLEAEPENVRRSFALMRDGGVTWARQQFPWEDIEIHGKGDFQDRRNDPPRSAWDKYDRIVEMAEDHGVELLVRLDDPPDWAFADPAASGPMGPPDDLADYGDFVAAVAERYCGRVRTYQVWNEPNIYPEWGERDVDPAGYAELLRVGAGRIREACPEAVIVSAALAQTTEPGGRNMDDLAYLEALYDAGWQEDFDVLAAQGFGLWTGPTDRRASRDRANFARVTLARDVMVRRGDAAKPIWITEMGWDSPPDDMAAPYGRVSEETRARYTREAFERMDREWPWAGVGFVWFFRRPNFEWHEQPQGYFRLVEPDWQPTESWHALAEYGRRPSVLWPGRHGPWARALQYTGPWRDVPQVGSLEARTGTATAELQFTFVGSGARLLFDPPVGEGEPATVFVVVDGDARAASLAPLDGSALWQLAAEGLGPGRHTAIVRVDGGEATLREVRVEGTAGSDPLRPLWVALALLAVALAGAAGLAVWLARRRSAPEPV